MTQRERWQALQAHLSAAQALIVSGDRQKALAEVNAALALDPDFLAAQALRDRLAEKALSAPAKPIQGEIPGVPLAGVAPAAPRAADRSVFEWDWFRDAAAIVPGSLGQPVIVPPAPVPPSAPVSQPLVSADKYAHFEMRAKRRRVDRRIEAAQSALARRKLHEAASVLDEIIALDSNLPELAGLTAEFDELRKAVATPHRGPWLMAAAVFAVLVLGASYLHESTLLPSRPVRADVALIAPPQPSLVSDPVPEDPPAVATTGVSDTVAVAIREPEPVRPMRVPAVRPAAVPAVLDRGSSGPDRSLAPVPALPAPATSVTPAFDPEPAPPASPTPSEVPLTSSDALPPPARNAATTAAASPPPARNAVTSAVAGPPPAPVPTPVPDEEGLVKQTLQLYRRAYEGLDAKSARAVWPAVNEAKLALAFEGLASQSITFDSCDVQVRGAVALATCRGSARYVPKIGSREPRVEPRVWSFALSRDSGDWKIESARTER